MEAWIPKYIIGYLFYFLFIVVIISNAVGVNANIYDLTPTQKDVIQSQDTDILTFLNKAFVLSQVNSSYAFINLITGIFGIIWLLVIAKAIKEVIPALPS